MATETNVSERIKRAEKHVNEQLSYGGIIPSTGPFGSTLEYRYIAGASRGAGLEGAKGRGLAW